ncbi:hypothetical protein B0H66DRAFT_267060 [Apodospora peruviana]|uniref:Prp 4 CRoW domain-containing protein n=1 Tax=Apodospora peruviana TaxID=516989 RepID=A0AAE0I646_9PEZI|nr:hypothetical protein B0H66DRAFT_267060 [Apodospora peruviana]
MLAKPLSALAALAFAIHVAAEPQPYKAAQVMKMSVKELFGRQAEPGYQPTQAVCGEGETCEAACGAGYQTCASSDEAIHCFNPAAAQTCCPSNTGMSCDAGYFCAADKGGETWCCPNGMDLDACATAYSITGGLIYETAPSTSSEVSSSTSSASPYPTSSATNTTTTTTKADSTTTCTSSLVPSMSFPGGSNSTSATFNVPAPTTTSKLPESGATALAPAGALFVLLAGFAALL